MEFIALQITPSPVRGWVASPYIKTTMPSVQGHPRILRTFPEILLTGLKGLDVGSAMGCLRLSLESLGTLPFCARCGAELEFTGERS